MEFWSASSLFRFLLIGMALLTGAKPEGYGQNSGDTTTFSANPQLWTEFYFYYPQTGKLEFYIDASYRQRFFEGNRFDRFTIRPSVRYDLLPWLWIGAGTAAFYTVYESRTNVLEARLWEGFSIKWATIGWPRYKSMRLSLLTRFEQRWFFAADDEGSLATNTRSRLMGSVHLPLVFKKPKVDKYTYLLIGFEGFLNLVNSGDSFLNDQTRTIAGMGYRVNYAWDIEFHFVFQRSRRQDGTLRTSDYLMRLKFKYNFLPNDPRENED